MKYKIAVFRALQLGDLLCAMPAVATLKYNYPQSTVYFIGLPHMETLIDRFDCVDEFIAFPGHPELPEITYDPSALNEFIQRMRAEKFDLLVQLQGDGTIVNNFLRSFGARRLVGFRPVSSDKSQDWMNYPFRLHEVDRHLELMRFLGLKILHGADYFPLFPKDWDTFASVRQQLAYPFVIIHVGSRDSKRQWPIQNFRYVGEFLYKKGYQIVLTGVSQEQELVGQMQSLLKLPTLNLCGRLNLGELGCLVHEASLLVCNCTGISHIAAAIATKSIVMSMDGEPERWGPQDQKIHKTFDARNAIRPTDIFEEIDRLLDLPPVSPNAKVARKISEG